MPFARVLPLVAGIDYRCHPKAGGGESFETALLSVLCLLARARTRLATKCSRHTSSWLLAGLQTEELLTKRQALLERKIEQELERAKVFLRQNNKRGVCGVAAASSCSTCCCCCCACARHSLLSWYCISKQPARQQASPLAFCMQLPPWP